MSERKLAQMVYDAVREEAERLLPQLDDPQPELREAAAEALGRIGSFEAVPALIRRLDDSERRVRWAAAGALGQIGSADAVPALIALLEDLDAGTREAAAQALGEIGSGQAVQELLKRLKDPSGHVRLMAIEALGQIGAAEALEALKECSKSEDESEKLCAMEAIEMIRSVGAELLETEWDYAPEPVLSEHPSLTSFAAGVRGAWKPWQVEHVRGCDFCQRLVAAEWSIRQPEVRTLAAYAADQDEFPYAAAMRQHLELGRCRRCALLSRTALVQAWAALIRLGKKLDLTALGIQTTLEHKELGPPVKPVDAYEADHGSAMTLHEGEGRSLLVFADFRAADFRAAEFHAADFRAEHAPSDRLLLEIVGEHGHRSLDLESGKDERVGSVVEALREFGKDIALLAAWASRESLEQLAAWMADPNAELRLAAVQVIGALGAAAATPEILARLTELLGDRDERVRKAASRHLPVFPGFRESQHAASIETPSRVSRGPHARPVFRSVLPQTSGESRRAYEMRLFSLAQQGHQDAFEALTREFWNAVYGRSRLILRNTVDAEDAAFTTFATVFRRMVAQEGQPQNIEGPSLIWKIARRTWVDILKRRLPEDEPLAANVNETESHEPDPEQLAMLKEHQNAIGAAISAAVLARPEQPSRAPFPIQAPFQEAWEQLDNRDRLILSLRYWVGLSVTEISQVLSISLASVSNRINRATDKLRKTLKEGRREDEQER